MILASLFPFLIRAQTMDQGTIQTTNNQSEWTTGQIQTPWINDVFAGQVLEINFNDANNSTQDGFWSAYDVSQDLEALNFDISQYIGFTWNNIPDTASNITIKYMLNDTANARHGVGGKIEGQGNRYEITALINYTDGNGQPASVEFKVPDHLYNVFMNSDTTQPVNFEALSGYDLSSNPAKLDSILNNIHDVMVLPDYQRPKTFMEQMNETSPYTGQGEAINSTLDEISDGGITNPFDPASITFSMEDHLNKDDNPEPKPSGPEPKGDGDIESKVFETDKGPVTVTYFMPEQTVTYPGAQVINNYQITTQAGEIPKLTVDAGGLEYTMTSTQVNDTVFDVALAVNTPEGVENTYNIAVDIEGTPVTTSDVTNAPDFNVVGAPNPFTSTTTLRYSLQNADKVDIVLYDMQGKEVQTIYSGTQQAGTHNLVVDGSKLKDGVYLVYISISQDGSYAVKLLKK